MSKRVLLVDDDEIIRARLREIFVGGGYTVVGEALNGFEAVEKHAALKPDLTTMDISMPFKNGIDATREIVQADPKAVVVICSSLGQEKYVMDAIEAGARDFVVKDLKMLEKVLTVAKKVLGAG